VLPEPGLGKQPNILFILADDFGYNDVSWNNEDVFTPNLEKLGREGVILDTYYASTRFIFIFQVLHSPLKLTISVVGELKLR